jgi:hypothetical protein
LTVVPIAILTAGLALTHIVAREERTLVSLHRLGYVFTLACIISGIIILLQPKRLRNRAVFLAALAAIISALNSVEMTFLHYFNDPAIFVYRHLPRPESQFATISSYLAIFQQYASPFVAVNLLIMVPTFLCFIFVRISSYSSRCCAVALAVAVPICVQLLLSTPTGGSTSSLDHRIMEIDPNISRAPLVAADRRDSFALLDFAYKPRTIVVIINENTSYFLPSSQDANTPLIERLIGLSGGRAGWHIYHNAVTNSSCTDVSVPSILTGSGTHEGLDKLHRMPFIFDIAKARGYKTAFYTSAVLEWANLRTFLSKAQIDSLVSASDIGHPLINDLGIDDIVMMKRFAKFIREEKRDQDLFVVVYTYAMHSPFQNSGDIEFPPDLGSRRSHALFVLETEHRMLFEALRDAGRLDDALIMITADHGHRVNPRKGQAIVPRVEDYSEETLRVPFLIKIPPMLPDEWAAAMRSNAGALVSNIDIAPTIAGLLGARLKGGLSYSGHSLLKSVPENRLSVALSINEWRSWPHAGVALARGTERFICNREVLCEFQRIVPGEEVGIREKERAGKHFLYMNEALKLPMVARNISKIYHQHFGVAWWPREAVRKVSRNDLSFNVDALSPSPPAGSIFLARAGHAPGHIMYGPYWSLPPGRYHGEVSLELAPGGEEGKKVCAVDIYDGQRILGVEDVHAGAMPRVRRVKIPFVVPGNLTSGPYEIRLWCAGEVAATVHDVAFVRSEHTRAARL